MDASAAAQQHSGYGPSQPESDIGPRLEVHELMTRASRCVEDKHVRLGFARKIVLLTEYSEGAVFTVWSKRRNVAGLTSTAAVSSIDLNL